MFEVAQKRAISLDGLRFLPFMLKDIPKIELSQLIAKEIMNTEIPWADPRESGAQFLFCLRPHRRFGVSTPEEEGVELAKPAGQFRPAVNHVLPLASIAGRAEAIESNKLFGHVVAKNRGHGGPSGRKLFFGRRLILREKVSNTANLGSTETRSSPSPGKRSMRFPLLEVDLACLQVAMD